MNIPRRRFLKLAAGSALPAFAGEARAQADLPPTIAMIVPFEAGSAPDVYARVIAGAMRGPLGRPIVVENKPGAAGNVGTQALARAPADGSSILVGTMALCEINPLVFSKLLWSMKDFTPVVKGIGAPLVLVAHPSTPARTLDELVAWAKSKPGALNFASYGAGTPAHFLGARLNARFGLDLAHVPYRGSASQITEILAGHSPIGFAQTQNSLPHVQSGALRAIAITSDQTYRLLPDVPTFAALGYPELSTQVWFGLLTRAGTPKPIFDRIAAAATVAHADARVREVLLPQGYDMLVETGADFARSIETGGANWAAVVKATGFRADE